MHILDAGNESRLTWKSAGKTKPGKPGVPVQIGTVDFSDRLAIMSVLDRAQKETEGLSYEVNYSVTSDGKVWRVSGESAVVNPSAIPSNLAGSYSYHNHPKAKTWYSFSAEDVRFFFQSGEAYAKASDHRYKYVMRRTSETLAVDPDIAYNMFEKILKTDVYALSDAGEIDVDEDGFHEVMKRMSQKYHFLYERRRIDGR